MPIQSLPVELIRSVVVVCRPRDLIALARVSAVFHDVAISILYDDLEDTIYGRSLSKCFRLLRVLATKPHLSKLVHRYRLRAVRGAIVTPLSSLHRLLRKALQRMENLKYLHLDVNGSCGDIFANCTFHLDKADVTMDYDAPFITWLESQSELTVLDLKSTWTVPLLTTGVAPSQNALPKLHALRANATIVANIAAGKPLDQVFIGSDLPSERDIIERAVPALRNVTSASGIQVLDMDTPDPSMNITELFASIADNIPRLEELGMVLNESHKVSLTFHICLSLRRKLIPPYRPLSTRKDGRDHGQSTFV
jgi:hypothetical protein